MIRSVVVLVVLARVTVALAQPAGAQAEVLFRQGRELLAAGKVAEACAAFEQSQKLEPAVTTLLNLAGCRERNGQLATAWGLFLDVERQTRSGDAAMQKMHEVAHTHAKKLEPRVSKLTISVAAESQIEGLEIARGEDAVAAAMWNRALPIDGGTYTITAHAPSMTSWSTQVTVGKEGDTKTVDVPKLATLAPAPVETKPAVAAPEPARPTPQPAAATASVEIAPPVRHRWLAPVAVGLGSLALGGVAVGLDLSSSSIYDQAKAEMTDQNRRSSLYSSANTRYQLAQGFGIAGVTCAVAAVWLYLRGGHRSDAASARTSLVVLPSGLGFARAW
ncbi:MAG TPA: tetratricopeptide repeat protein [Kofleriaceae bacterium]|nr:tetratricopeptide repeat protein [Kofleriaceae bacterium]